METSSNVPGLPIEGELAETTVDDGSNLAPDQTRGETSKTQPSKTQTLHTHDANIDYQKMNNPQARPTVRSPSTQPQVPLAPPTMTMMTEKHHANLTFEPSLRISWRS